MKILIFSSLLFSIALVGVCPAANAGDLFFLDKVAYPIATDTNIASSDEVVNLKLMPNSTNADVIVKMMVIVDKNNISNFFDYPQDAVPASDLYFIRFSPENNFTINPRVTIKYTPTGKLQEIYYFDWLDLQFKKLDALRDLAKGTLSFDMPAKEKLMFALFDGPSTVGKASWYVHAKYGSELIAASTDWPINTRLKVINAENNKEVIVTVKDYGPKKCADWTAKEQQTMGPCQERVIDLSKSAFSKIANLTQGLINVIINAI